MGRAGGRGAGLLARLSHFQRVQYPEKARTQMGRRELTGLLLRNGGLGGDWVGEVTPQKPGSVWGRGVPSLQPASRL